MSDPRDEQGSSDRDDHRSPAEPGGSGANDRNEPTGTGRDGSPEVHEKRPLTDQSTEQDETGPTTDQPGAETSIAGDRQREGGTRDTTSRQDGPARPPGERDGPSRAGRGQYLLDIVSSVLVVVAIGGLLFATSGVWPPLVAIESGSMEPHIQEGDLVFVMEEERFPGAGAHEGSGVVTAHAGEDTGYRMFEEYGDVIVYQPYGSTDETPIIHRAMFWVEDGENWYDRADPEFRGTADDCGELNNCPAPHAGFITKGDNTNSNDRYDQVMGISGPVKPGWVMGTAEVRVPILGEIRLLSGQADGETVAIGSQLEDENSSVVGPADRWLPDPARVTDRSVPG